jgi:transposase
MAAYSMDLRERVVQAYDAKVGSQAAIAKLFNVSLCWVQKLLRRRRETGSIAPLPHGGGQKLKFSGETLAALKQDVETNPDASLQELLDSSGIKGSLMAVHRALQRLGCRRKKSHCMRRNKTGRM